jgi:hypothetical protein
MYYFYTYFEFAFIKFIDHNLKNSTNLIIL